MIDDMGNQIYPGSLDNGATDVEYSPTIERKICAQDERFASVNEAIGRLEYNLEQHIEKCADGLAPLADFISSSWAVLDDALIRIEQLEESIGQMQAESRDNLTAAYLHLEKPDASVGREYMRGFMAGARASQQLQERMGQSAWEEQSAKLEALRAKWASVPWDSLRELSGWPCERPHLEADEWIDQNAQREAARD